VNTTRKILQLINALYFKSPHFKGKDRITGLIAKPMKSYRGEVHSIQDFKWNITDEDSFWTYIKSCERFSILSFIKIVASADVFIDIGANRGYYSLVALSSSKSINVHSFEVNQKTVSKLESHLSQFKNRQIEVHDLALGSYNGTATLHSYEDFGSGADTLFPLEKYGKTRSLEVPVRTLDSIFENVDLATTYVMKIDVEGGELDIIRGGAYFIAQANPIILMEVNVQMLNPSGGPAEVRKVLASLDYQLFWINERGSYVRWEDSELLPHVENLGLAYSANYICLPKHLSLESLNLV
jgi:FkbM family methyltransferase